MAEDTQARQEDREGHAPTEISPGPILKTLLALLIVVTGVILVLLPWEHEETPEPVATPAPRLLTRPAANLAEYRRSSLQRLSSYGWVDRDAGVAHIPVERAIEILSGRARESTQSAGGRAP